MHESKIFFAAINNMEFADGFEIVGGGWGQEREKTIRLDNVTSESNAMMYPLNDEKGEQMPVWAG